MHLHLHRRDLPLRSAFRLSRNVTTLRRTLIVELRHDQHSGFGEVSDNAYYPMANPNVLREAMLGLEDVLAKADPDDPRALHAALQSPMLWPGAELNRFALAALDMAAWDLAARRAGKPLYAYLGLEWEASAIPVSNYTLSIGKPEEVLAKAQASAWPQYKVKLGAEDDIATLALLREKLGPELLLAVDANAGWSSARAMERLEEMLDFDISFVEQPLAAGQLEQTRQLREAFRDTCGDKAVPLVADEDCQTEGDIAGLKDVYDVVNIKLSKCGGITPALRMVSAAKAQGMDVMFGCMIESSFGIGILRHLAPLAMYIDLDGHMLIRDDPGKGIAFLADGRPARPEGPGSGVRWR